MTFTHVVYVDEAGDEGFGKLTLPNRGGQSQWLVLGCMIVRGEDDAKLPKWRDGILARFPNQSHKDIHFRKHRHEQKVVICQEVARLPVFACMTFSNKCTIPGSRWAPIFKQSGFFYNYMVRWLLERATSFCAQGVEGGHESRCRVKVIFSRRGGTNYESMATYLTLMRDGLEVQAPVRSIRWDVFDPAHIAVENHSKRAGLQIADVFTSAFFSAVEANLYGNYEPRYAEILRPCVIRHRNSALNAGVTPVPSLASCQCNAEQASFFRGFAR